MAIERTAIVTGAGKRVGAVIARALLDDGWTVVAHVHHETDDVPDGAIKAVADLSEAGCADTIFAAAAGSAAGAACWSITRPASLGTASANSTRSSSTRIWPSTFARAALLIEQFAAAPCGRAMR